MVHIKKADRIKKNNSQSCIVWEYDFPSKNLGVARSTINGRYPVKGAASNNVCDLTYVVLSGNGTIHTRNGDFSLEEGDAFFISKNSQY